MSDAAIHSWTGQSSLVVRWPVAEGRPMANLGENLAVCYVCQVRVKAHRDSQNTLCREGACST